MKMDNIDKKYSSKLYRFFDLLYRLLVINLTIIILSIPIVTCFPIIVAGVATIKNNMNETGIFKPLFRNFKKYFLKSFLMGLWLLAIIAVGGYAYYFWAFSKVTSETVAQIGLGVIIACLIIFAFMIVHIPLLMITFEKLPNLQIFKTSLYVAVRYFLTTILMLINLAVIIGVFIIGIALPVVLGLWMIIGITLPMYLTIKFTSPIYYQFSKIDMNKINEQVEEDLKNEQE